MTQSRMRTGAALLGVTGALALAGCSGAPETASPEAREYADGTYTASGTYQTPETLEEVSVTLTLAGGLITAVDVVGKPQTGDSVKFQGMFIGGIADAVVGKSIDEISVRRVAGSSLTSGGFNRAVAAIREQAAT